MFSARKKILQDMKTGSNVRVFHLHGGVVERDERGEQVQVTSGEHQCKQDLTLSRNTCEETAEGTEIFSHLSNRFTSYFLAFKKGIVQRMHFDKSPICPPRLF